MIGKNPRKRHVRGKVRWCVDYLDATGTRRRKIFDTKAEAQVLQDQVNKAPTVLRPLNPYVDPDVRFGLFAAQWFWDRRTAPNGWRVGSERCYRAVLQRLLPFRIGGKSGTVSVGGIDFPADALAALPVRDLGPGHIEALVRDMAAGGYAPGSIRLTVTLFGALCDRAVAKGLLAANPLTRHLRKDLAPFLTTANTEDVLRHFTQEQARTFLAEAARSSRLHALYLTGFCAGLRIGELVGLQLPDVQGTRLQILRQLDPCASVREPEAILPKGGKTRTVDLGRDVRAVLDRIAAERPKLALRNAWRPVPNWVFVTANGTPYSRQVVRTDFRRVLRRCGLGDTNLTVHSLRHSWVRMHVERGADPKWLQSQAGHSSIKVTLDLYARHAQLTAPGAADALASALVGNQTGNGALSRPLDAQIPQADQPSVCRNGSNQ